MIYIASLCVQKYEENDIIRIYYDISIVCRLYT